MEVHHHPDLHHSPKNWREYFLEFIMIFLAVTLGFFAESYREYRSDRAKEIEYVVSFVKNLAKDTADLHYFIKENKRKASGLDTLRGVFMRYLYRSEYDYQNFDSLYQYCSLYIPTKYIFRGNDATMLQMKNSGGFRLIRTKNTADSLTAYDITNTYTQFQGTLYNDQITKMYETWAHSLDLNYISDDRTFDYVPLSVIIVTREDFKFFCNKILQGTGTIRYYVEQHLEPQLEAARKLISYLKSTYDI